MKDALYEFGVLLDLQKALRRIEYNRLPLANFQPLRFEVNMAVEKANAASRERRAKGTSITSPPNDTRQEG
ncbi:hypothetical protein LCGC14_1612820 [marine sediment metagenome]|uniref:Uncharacterized protein n=1 Tax=marine sediment metagenome TaxID=412755 RepID=A0A0F9L7Y8_9ZZZZ